MADLSNQPINTSYKGLLTLQTATSGITATPQELQDGLGNNTGLQIGTNRLEGGNLFNFYKPSIPKYMGSGLSATSLTPGAGAQNTLTCSQFYDVGLYSYSAFTINCNVLEAGTSVDITFYNSQYLDNYGYVPYQKLTTEVNIATTSTGQKVGTFATPLTFSGSGGGMYWAVVRYNTASTPVLRLTQGASNTGTYLNTHLSMNVGYTFNPAGTAAILPFQSPSTSVGTLGVNYNTSSFPTTFTSTELNTITSVSVGTLGFLLHTIR